jgi:mRNA interferase RelE/StbE
MAWQIEFSDLARKNLRDLDRQTAIRILRFLSERIAGLGNPRDLGEPLKGSAFATLWKYRVGAY